MFNRQHSLEVVNRGWNGWMVSLTQWTWVWATSGRWWWMGKPGVLQSMGLQRARHDWATEQHMLQRWGQVPISRGCHPILGPMQQLLGLWFRAEHPYTLAFPSSGTRRPSWLTGFTHEPWASSGVGSRGGWLSPWPHPYRRVMKFPSRNFLLALGKGRPTTKGLNTLFRWLCLFWRINGG